MLKYYFQKFMFQIVFVAAIVLFAGLFVYASLVSRNDPPPADVKAQFQSSLGAPRVDGIAPSSSVDISTRHMSSQEMADLLEIILAECLSFNPGDFDTNTRLVQNYFTPGGYQQYQDYLTQTNFGEIIKTRSLQSGVYAERSPLEVNSLSQNGAYKWLFEVPITVSFIPYHAETYQGGATKAQNQRFTLRVQFTRVNEADNPNKVRIEIWQVLAPRG